VNYSIAEYVSPALDQTIDYVPHTLKTLLICTTPRTGGHNLCRLLNQRGLGVPTEYFGPQVALPLIARWCGQNYSDLTAAKPQLGDYGRHLLEKRSIGGLFSAKLFFSDMKVAKATLGIHINNATHLFVLRRNMVSQAISLLALLKTGHAFDSEEVLPHLLDVGTLNDTVVEKIFTWLQMQNSLWCHYLASMQHVLWTDMETVLDRGPEVVNMVATKLGHPVTEQPSSDGAAQYNQDRALKQDLLNQYGDLLRNLAHDAEGRIKIPPNAQRVC
jgi:LPS sulfotransferase NodH